MKVSKFEEQILATLLWKVRVMASKQLEQMVGNKPDALLRTLKRKQLVESITLRTQMLVLSKPLFSWSPSYGDCTPDFWKISWQAESRFEKTALHDEKIYLATELACRHFGGVGGTIRQPFQLLHDLGTASMFVAKLSANNEQAKHWKSEDVLRRYFRHLNIRKIPDAAGISNDSISRVFEFAGRGYSGTYIKMFHQFWKRKNIPYEIW